MDVNRGKVKLLIELSATAREADEVIVENYGFKTLAEKLAFLKGMFDFEIISRHDTKGTTKEKSDEMDYWTVLEIIISSKIGK